MAAIDLSRLNDAQRDVVQRLDEPLFVSAGAGSGKTFTLTARLVYALSKGSAPQGGRYLSSIDEALVITFTKAAALEIKDRVKTALRQAGEDDPYLREESLRVDGAWISTIHGMCSRILKRHGVDLGLDASFEVCADSVQEALLARALEETLSVAQNDEALQGLMNEFPLWGQTSTGSSSIVGMIRQIKQEATKCIHGYDDLVCPQSNETPSLTARVLQCLEGLAACDLAPSHAKAVNQSLSAVSAFCSLGPTQQTAARACEALEQVRVPGIRKKDIAPLKDECKQALAEALVCAHFERVQGFAQQLVDLAKKVDARYAELKHERSFVDNDDLIELALRAVESNAQIAKDYEGRFKLVMIDEFQDTDQKQLRLISLLSGKDARHLTTVGDAQQSIYRFRGGDVEVFRERGRQLPEESHVQMDVNYRSDHHVLALVERICGDAGILDDFLKLAGNAGRRSNYVAHTDDGSMPPRVFMEVAQGGSSQITSATLAAQLADRLSQLAQAGQPVRSMALLLGTTTNVSLYLDALRARGLPAIVAGGSSFSSTTEVGVIQALLHTLANPHDTESGLFRVLSSEMFCLDSDDFCQLGTRKQDVLDAPTKRPIEQCFISGELELYDHAVPSRRLVAACDVLHRAFGRLGRWELADICQAVVEESGWLTRLEHKGTDGLSVAANVLAAIRYVRDLTTNLGLGVSRAATEFDQWLTIAKLTPKGLSGDTIDAVQVMTIHGSKGLQYGVTAVAECWSNQANRGRLAIGPVANRRVACLIPHPEYKQFSKMRHEIEPPQDSHSCTNVAEWASFIDAEEFKAQAAEKARLLYVALTRAEEALVVGIPVAQAERYRSPLALGVLGAFGELDELMPGECQISIEPDAGIECEGRDAQTNAITRRRMSVEPGLVRVVSLQKGENKDDPYTASSAKTLTGFDGELPGAASQIVLLGTDHDASQKEQARSCQHESTFELFDSPTQPLTTRGWQPRDGVYSYSSIHAKQEALRRTKEGLAPKLAPPVQDEDKSAADDVDKATALGSAFHALAQTMVQTNANHDPKRLEALARTWHLSERQRARLSKAITCWEKSDLRREASTYSLRRAEVPFFVSTPTSPHGSYFEGAIDLLCTNGTDCTGDALVIDYKTGDIGLTEAEVYKRHEQQAQLYANMLLGEGFEQVTCAFICVETGIIARWVWKR